jgi:hypothetical protein
VQERDTAEVRRYIEELARGNNLGLLPILWKVPLIAGYQIIGAGDIGAFEE